MPSRRVAAPLPILAGAVSLKFRSKANRRPNISASTGKFKALRQTWLTWKSDNPFTPARIVIKPSHSYYLM